MGKSKNSGFLAYSIPVEPASVRPCVRPSVCVHTFKHEYLETNGSITTKFYLKHHWGGGLAA